VLLDAGGHREDVGSKTISSGGSDFADQDAVAAPADVDAARELSA